jgi:hypothetical protein
MRAYTADMIPGGASPVINVSQYDNDYAVTVTLIEGAEIYTPPSGATIRVEGTKPDGHGFEYPCTYQGNVVTMPIYTQMTVVSGRFPIELVVYQSGLRVGSCNIIFAVEKAPLGEDTDISETVIPDIIDAAQSSAEAAQEAAEQAQEAAAQVLSSQIVTDASGSIASFSDGADDVAVKSLVASITPVQNLNGQANPYPPGGGKNKLHVGASTTTVNGVTFTVNDDGTVKVNGTATANTYFYLIDGASGTKLNVPDGSYTLSGCPSGGSFSTYYLQANDGTWKYDYGSGTTLTSSGQNIGSIGITVKSGTTMSNLVFKPMIRLASESDSTYEPYSNICPISGRTGMTVTRAGKNLLDNSNWSDGSASGINYSKNSDGSITCSGTSTGTVGKYIWQRNTTDLLDKGNYILSAGSQASSSGERVVVSIARAGGSTFYIEAVSGSDYPFTINEGDYVMGVLVRPANNATINATIYPMIRLASFTDSTYEPYAAQTYPITWQTEAGEIYGGTLDVVSGVLTVDRASVDMGTLTWYRTTSYAHPVFYCLIDAKAASSHKAACSMFSVLDNPIIIAAQGFANNAADCQIASSAGNKQVYVRYDAITDAAAFKTAVTGQTLVYPLATPQTYQLTPTEVRTILGGNTIYTDAGDVSVEYIADTKLYIDNKIAELQALVLENN